jgi:hypothetical protein
LTKYSARSKQQYALKRKTVKSKVQEKLRKKPKPIPFKAVPKKQPKPALKIPPLVDAAPEAEQKLPSGYKAKIHYSNENVKVTADIRYETEKTNPLIQVKNIGPKGEIVHKTFVGPAKREVWLDETGKEVNKADVRQAQLMPDGSLKPIIISKTKDINVDPVAAEVPQDFLPYSYLEVWGEGESDEDGIRKMAADLMKTGKVGAIKEFSHGYGKVYVGFLRPIMSKDGKKFGVEIMLAENKRSRRRWMLAEKDLKPKAEKPDLPTLW